MTRAHLRLVHDVDAIWDETRFPRPDRKPKAAPNHPVKHDIVIEWVEFVIMAGTVVAALTFASAAFLIAMGSPRWGSL